MAKNVEIKKTVFDRKEYISTIDNRFKFFKEPDPVVDPDTVEELFRLYDKLYITIPIEGVDNSHQYLVERSSELYKIDAQLESIQPLLDEVASLRNQILEQNRQILELETQLANGGELNFADAEQMQLLRTQLETANATIATLENANSLANRATEMASKAAEEAAKKAEEAAKTSAENQAKAAAAASSANTTAAVKEIKDMMNKKNTTLYHARRFLKKPRREWARLIHRARFNGSFYNNFNNAYAARYWWLFAEDSDEREYPSVRRRRGYRFGKNAKKNFLIAKNKNQAGDMTVDFLVDELKQGGFKANEIKDAIDSFGNLKVRTRIITYKDPEREDDLGYNFTG
tara:strand:+ start:6914 stop:7948 length:1035 start_codon:yes stop_codon:yes gene_type:complete